MKETFGEYIHKLRVDNNLTLTKLAAALDIDQSTLSKIENNKRTVPEEILPKLARTFKLDRMALDKEYFSEKIASIIYKQDNSTELFLLAEEKVKYLRSKSIKQRKLKL
jgi:transcriptional regulator with XRE-family HTH domain